eukprot:7144246-Pyramimonas_sp.AAC.1
MHCGSVYVGRLHCLCRRLCVGKEGRVSVVDIGTGPFALLAIAAAKAGARKVRVQLLPQRRSERKWLSLGGHT